MVSLRSALKATNCPVENLIPEEDDPTVCPACHKRLRTARGVQAHLQSARSCSWYKKGKLKALTMPGQFEETLLLSEEIPAETPFDDLPGDGFQQDAEEDEDMEPHEVMDEFHEQLFELIPTDFPKQHSVSVEDEDEDEDEDERLVEEHATAGQHIRIVPTLQERWKKLFGNSQGGGDDLDVDMDGPSDEEVDREADRFAPFASELDWKIAKWAVGEGIGHKSFDRLMGIPGVCLMIAHDSSNV
jgi:hypothetical protein